MVQQPAIVAVNQVTGDVYVVDRGNVEVQEFTASGEFIRMFGTEVNETAHNNGETANEDVCPVNIGDKCKAGVEGSGDGQFEGPIGVAIDNSCFEQGLTGTTCTAEDSYNEDVYVVDRVADRVQNSLRKALFVVCSGVRSTKRRFSITKRLTKTSARSIRGINARPGSKERRWGRSLD